ncbi:MAG: NPCBM/NEW2 domain-containing protein, partial [FCB group bacterium]|nr:NPCBM/NEW2 domain-containing protein [FCB group bacterium]
MTSNTRSHGWARIILALALLAPTLAHAEDVMDRMAFHTQVWGKLTQNGAVHADNTPAPPLKIAGKTYQKGLGMHAPSETIFELGGGFLKLEAEVGVQVQGNPAGTVEFKVLVDGKEVFSSGVMKDGDPAKPVSISLQGAQELQLITTDAGDGITCDAANWANFNLVPDPNAMAAGGALERVNVAPFAQVASWDPDRMEGTKATRLQTMPAEDLFLSTEITRQADGYKVPVQNGKGCIGLQWLERRRLTSLELEFASPDAAPEGFEIQFWTMEWEGVAQGGSRWQGHWVTMPMRVTMKDNRWSFIPEWGKITEGKSGALKVRWIFPSAKEVVVKDIAAYTASAWKTADLLIQVDESAANGNGTLAMYNGVLTDPAQPLGLTFPLNQPLHLQVRYTQARPWNAADRTVLRFTLPQGAFGVAVDDVMEKGCVYVEHAGLFVAKEPVTQDLAAYKQSIADKKTILEEVRTMPDQTVEQAMSHTHRPDADLGPTMLSLANDNRKFIVEREGKTTFDDNPEVYNHFESMFQKPYTCEMNPQFGQGEHESVQRVMQGGWIPIQVATLVNHGIRYQQRTFVAPFDAQAPAADAPVWRRDRPLGVAEFTVENPGTAPADAALTLAWKADAPEGIVAEVSMNGQDAVVNKNGKLMAVCRVAAPLTLAVEGGNVRITGRLDAGAKANCVAYLPRWEQAALADLPQASASEELAATTQAYWEAVMKDAMRVELPDPLFNNLVPASQVHCLLAARNENGENIAPWIASWYYGPLESEANSLLRGMQFMGQLDYTKRGLEYFIARYNDEGFLTTGYTVMGTGWHLWTLGEYYELTRDKDWLRNFAPKVERVCRWIMEQRAKTKHIDANGVKAPEYGLMPPGVGADWGVYAYYFYLNGYYCAGLRSAATALSDIGWPGAEEMLADAEAYRGDILNSYEWVQSRAPVFALRDGSWVPEYPVHVFSPAPIESFYKGEDAGRSWCYDVELGSHHLVPMGILPADSPKVDWMMNHMEDVQFLREGWFYYPAKESQADWFSLGGFAKVQPYYARNAEISAMRDDVKPFIRTYFNSVMSLLNREDLSLWEHFMNGAYNKTHETGYFLYQSRLMLVMERGDELWLAPFVTDQWLKDGMRVAASQAPTLFGNVDFAITSHVAQGAIEATITPPTRLAPKAIVLRLRHPEGKPCVGADITGAASHEIDNTRQIIRII